MRARTQVQVWVPGCHQPLTAHVVAISPSADLALLQVIASLPSSKIILGKEQDLV